MLKFSIFYSVYHANLFNFIKISYLSLSDLSLALIN